MNNWSVSLILWDNAVLTLNGVESVCHVIIGRSVHVSGSPLEEALLSNRSSLAVSSVVEFVLRLPQVGVIKVRSGLAPVLRHIKFNIDI